MNMKEVRDEHYTVVGYTIDHGAGIEEHKDSHFDTVGYTIDQQKQFEDAIESFNSVYPGSNTYSGGSFLSDCPRFVFYTIIPAIGIPLILLLLGKSELASYSFRNLIWIPIALVLCNLFDSLLIWGINIFVGILRFLAVLEFIVLNWNYWN